MNSLNKTKILVVEDEVTLAMIIKETLEEKENFVVYTAENGDDGLQKFHSLSPDIIIADVMMPKIDGFEMVHLIRQSDENIPILMLSARSAVNDVVKGFETGCNDYLKKPFGMNELIVRIKALLKRSNADKKQALVFEIGKYKFDSVTQNLYFLDQVQLLSNRESEILKRLCENRNQVLYTKNLLLDLWGDDSIFNARSLHVFITKLRKRFSEDTDVQILNVRGIGYKFVEVNSEI
jgi:DNA-binding response OmpR family regulator